jgi:adenine-specific DNA-methyltransferase
LINLKVQIRSILNFESDIEGSTQTMSMGKFEVTKTRIHDDLLQEELKKKPAKSAASFVTKIIKNQN